MGEPIILTVGQMVGGSISVVTTPPVSPSPYFTYDSNRVITGLYPGSPNVWEEGTYTDYNDWEYATQHDDEYPEKPYSGWTYGGSDVVENYATAIGDYAFGDDDYTYNSIPPSKGITGNITFQNITSIGANAFRSCSGLTNVTIPDSVSSIGNYAFQGCSGLTSVTIPDSVTRIGDSAFYGCSGLTSVTIGDGVTSIGTGAFGGCESLTSITIGSNIETIGYGAFNTWGNPITLTIGKTVTEVQAMGTTNYDSNTNVLYSDWYLPSGSTIVCTDGTISIE